MKISGLIPAIAAGAFLLSLPAFGSTHTLMLVSLATTTAITTAGLSVVSGMSGQISLAQAAFCAIGAYGASLLATRAGLPMWASIPVATLLAGAIGYVLGWLALRVSGHYLALVTLSFAGIVYVALLNLTGITGGAAGMTVPPLTIAGFRFRSALSIYYLCLGAAAIVFWTLGNLGRSRWGRAFESVRQSELAAQSLGLDIRALKSTAFAISGALGAFGGALQSLQSRYLDPVQFGVIVGVTYLVVLVIGGVRFLEGAIVGAALYVFAPEVLGSMHSYMGFAFAMLLIFVLLVLPEGLNSLPGKIRSSFPQRRTS